MSYKRIAVVLVLVVVVVAAGVYFSTPTEKVYGQAAGHKVYKNEVDKLRPISTEVSEKDVVTVLVDKYFYEALAKQEGASISDAELKQETEDRFATDQSSPYTIQKIKNQLYENKLQAKVAGSFKGQLIVAHFSRNIPYESPNAALDKKANPSIGNAVAIDKDKKYAESFMNQIYQDLSSGKITFDQAIAREKSDPQVGEGAYQTLPHSGPFNTAKAEDAIAPIIRPKNARDRMSSLQTGQVSKPFAVKVSNSFEGDGQVESYYVLVKLDEVNKPKGGSFDQYKDSAKKRLGYRVY